MSRNAISRLLAVVIVVVVVVAVLAGIAAYMLYMPAPPTPAPTPTPTPAPTPAPTPTPPPEEIPTEIRIGTVQHLSGPYAAVSYYLFQGIQIGVQWINDHGGINFKGKRVPVRLIYYDDESNVDYSVRLVTKLIVEDKVDLVILPWSPEFTLATAPICEKYKMVSVSVTGADPEYQQGFKYMLGYVSGHGTVHYEYQMKVIRDADPNARRVAFVLSSADVGGFFETAIRNAAKKYGFEIIYSKMYPEDITDASPLLREIAAVNPDVFVGGTFPASGMLIASQLRDLKINIKWVVLTMVVNGPDFGQAFGKWAVGFIGGSPWEPEPKWEIVAAREGKEYVGPTNDEIVEYWRKMGFKERPRADVGTGVCATVMLAKCVEAAQSLDSEKIVKAAVTLDVYTCRGRIKLDPENPAHMLYPDGLPVIMQWQRKDNNLIYAIVYPYEFATAKAIPMPTWEEKEAWPELTLELALP
ncbi:MAG: amino acid ABC transporter substrate-binding protein [Candidatus Bathyarchaeia archaeon]